MLVYYKTNDFALQCTSILISLLRVFIHKWWKLYWMWKPVLLNATNDLSLSSFFSFSKHRWQILCWSWLCLQPGYPSKKPEWCDPGHSQSGGKWWLHPPTACGWQGWEIIFYCIVANHGQNVQSPSNFCPWFNIKNNFYSVILYVLTNVSKA